MGKLHTVGKVSIRVYANDHLPPHFHLVGPDAEALIAIADLTVYAGTVPSKASLAWAVANLDAIRAEWNRVNPRFPIA